MPTNEDLDALRESIEAKRVTLAEAEQGRLAKEQELAVELEVAQLKAEGARLDALIASAESAGRVTQSGSGAATPMAQAEDDMKRAVAQQEAVKEAEKAAEQAAKDAEQAAKDEVK